MFGRNLIKVSMRKGGGGARGAVVHITFDFDCGGSEPQTNTRIDCIFNKTALS